MRRLCCWLLLASASLSAGCGRFGFELGADESGSQGSDRDGGGSGSSGGPDGSSSGGVNEGSANGASAGDGAIEPREAGGADANASGADASSGCGPSSLPKHRYSFDGSGALVTDSASGANGNVIGTSLGGNGSVTLDGNGDHVALPSGLISGLNAVTIMLWVEWNSGGQRQTMFDVGQTQQGPGLAGTPITHVQLKVSTPQTGFVLTTKTTNASSTLSVFPLLGVGAIDQVVAVLDGTNDVVTLYKNGERIDSAALAGLSLSGVTDTDFWLGGTLDAADSDFRGLFHEARVYPGALDDCQVARADSQGPDGDPDVGCPCP